MRIPSITMLYEKAKKVNEFQGSSLLSPAHGLGGARATPLSFILSIPPASEKIAGGFQQAGPEGKCYALPTGQAKRKNFCLPRSILSETKDCYGVRLLAAPTCPPKPPPVPDWNGRAGRRRRKARL